MMAIEDLSVVLDEEKLAELEIEKRKRRRVGRLMAFSRRFSKHKTGLFGTALIVFIIFLAVFAPFIAGDNQLIPYNPEEIDLPAQYLPPFSYEGEELRGDFPVANKGTTPSERKVAGIVTNENVTFVNGTGSTKYRQISQLESINQSGTEIWAGVSNPGTVDPTTGQITLADTTFNGFALVDYRFGGKVAFQFKAATDKIIAIRLRVKVLTDSQESAWQGDLNMHVYEEEALETDDDPIASSLTVSGLGIITGQYTEERDVYFSFRTLSVTIDNIYWAVIDCDIENLESLGVTQLLVMAVDNPGSRLFGQYNENVTTRGWNAISGWNIGIQVDPGDGTLFSADGFTPYFVTFQTTNRFHVLGTDALGRDILSVTIWGARASLTVAFLAISIQVIIGITLGATAGYFGGKIDNIIMRITDLFLAVPTIFLLLIAVTVWERISLIFIAITIGAFGWSGTARIVRAEFLSLREMEYTDAARALGVGNAGIIFKHLLPNAMSPVIVTATLGTATAILIEAGLSFLGFGDPAAISWGTAIQWGMQGHTLRFAPWVATIPGLAIFVAVLSFNLVGDALRDALDPRLR